MKLKQSQKELIDGLYSNLSDDIVSMEDIQEHIMDECMDQDELFDLSDDQEGDLYQTYYNLIWDYVIEKMGAPF